MVAHQTSGAEIPGSTLALCNSVKSQGRLGNLHKKNI